VTGKGGKGGKPAKVVEAVEEEFSAEDDILLGAEETDEE